MVGEVAENWDQFQAPATAQVLTAWVAQAGDDSPEWIVGLYVTIELAQQARSEHMEENPGEYDYCIEPWVIGGSGSYTFDKDWTPR